MSTANLRARRTAERELKRLERRLAADPTRPIFRAADRRSPQCVAAVPAAPCSPLPPGRGPRREGNEPPSDVHLPAYPIPHSALRIPHSTKGGPDASVRAAARPQEAGTPPPPHLPPSDDGSTFPLWARLLTLPPDLDPTYRAFLYRFIQNTIGPRDDHEHWLAARIALAMARLHLNAAREPESPSPAWLRFEALADRQLRQAHRDIKAHRASHPPTSNSQPATSNDSSPQTQPLPPDPIFAPPQCSQPAERSHARHVPADSGHPQAPRVQAIHPPDPP